MNYGRIQTPAMRKAAERNFLKYRVKGILSQASAMINSSMLTCNEKDEAARIRDIASKILDSWQEEEKKL